MPSVFGFDDIDVGGSYDVGYERLDGPIEPHYSGSAYCEKFHCNAPENDVIHDYEDPEEFGG